MSGRCLRWLASNYHAWTATKHITILRYLWSQISPKLFGAGNKFLHLALMQNEDQTRTRFSRGTKKAIEKELGQFRW